MQTEITLPDELDRSTVWSLQKVAKRWDTISQTAEGVLKKAGIDLVVLQQKPKLGVRLGDLLAFEQRYRQAQAKKKAECQAREAADAARHAEAHERLRLKKEAADKLVAEQLAKESTGANS